MYAIVDIAGSQLKVEKNQKLYVNRLEGKEGDKVEFDQVLLVDNDGKVTVGNPSVEGALVSAKIIQHLKGDKVLVFKKKRRKGYQKQNGFRAYLTQILIEEIAEKGAKKSAAKAEPKKAAKAEAAVETEEAKPKAPKKAAPKKEEAPKAEAVAETPVVETAPEAPVAEAPKAEETPKAEGTETTEEGKE